ncbi:MAG: right-handed parallel beta-helix repeat-containing protein [Muribaculaceae bacterium]|nr:right-handed parallel beta-helix repeat-containing protein [Muribaculaceae bacterium]
MKNHFIVGLFALSWSLQAHATDYYVSPSGDDSNDGSLGSPFLSIRKAIETAKPGTTIFLREGTYRPKPSEVMRKGAEGVYDCVYDLTSNGSPESPIVISGYPGENATIDLSDVKPDARVIGFHVKSDYWHLRDFDIIGIQVTQTGHTQSINVALFGGNNCIIERVNMHDGMGIGVYATRGKNNLVLNCDAYNNYDPVSENGKGGNCDGFGFHMNNASFTGNVIRGCRAWRNSDDGFDLINNLAPVTIENCWAWENGYDADRISRGDGTGFKSGGYGMKQNVKAGENVPRNVVRNCIAWSNKEAGFYANHHLGGLDFHNNTSFRNKRNFNMVNRKSHKEAVDVDGYDHHLTNNLSYSPTMSGAHCVNIDTSSSTYVNNSFLPEISLNDSDFLSLDPSQLLYPRNEDGSLPDITFLKLKDNSKAAALKIGCQFSDSDDTASLNPTVESREDCSGNFYNLNGIPTISPSDGIYIHNRQKVMIP